jgi:hypothetical protein
MRVHKCRAFALDGMVKVNTDGRRASGDVTTSLGNVIIVMATLFNVKLTLADFEVLNAGDDNVLIMERTILDLLWTGIDQYFLDAGFLIKKEGPYFTFEEIVFCQQSPCLVHGNWRMIRDLRAVFRKDCMCLQPTPHDGALRKWMAAVGCAGAHLCDGVPVLQALYDGFKRNGVAITDQYFGHVMAHTYFTARRNARRDSTIDDDARVSFYRSSGIFPDIQVKLEAVLKDWTIGDMVAEPIEVCVVPPEQGCQLEEYLFDTTHF